MRMLWITFLAAAVVGASSAACRDAGSGGDADADSAEDVVADTGEDADLDTDGLGHDADPDLDPETEADLDGDADVDSVPDAQAFAGVVESCAPGTTSEMPPGDQCEGCDWCAPAAGHDAGYCALEAPSLASGFCTVPCDEESDCPPGACGLATCVPSCSVLFDGRTYCDWIRTEGG